MRVYIQTHHKTLYLCLYLYLYLYLIRFYNVYIYLYLYLYLYLVWEIILWNQGKQKLIALKCLRKSNNKILMHGSTVITPVCENQKKRTSSWPKPRDFETYFYGELTKKTKMPLKWNQLLIILMYTGTVNFSTKKIKIKIRANRHKTPRHLNHYIWYSPACCLQYLCL